MKRCYSLKRKKEFRRLYNKGRSAANPVMVLIYRKNATGLLHVGLSVSKKLGNSVERNRIKRRLRAALDEYLNSIDKANDYIIIARQGIKDIDFTALKNALCDVFSRAGALNISCGSKGE